MADHAETPSFGDHTPEEGEFTVYAKLTCKVEYAEKHNATYSKLVKSSKGKPRLIHYQVARDIKDPLSSTLHFEPSFF